VQRCHVGGVSRLFARVAEYAITLMSCRLGDRDRVRLAGRHIETILIAVKMRRGGPDEPANHMRVITSDISKARIKARRVSCSLAKFRLSETIHYLPCRRRLRMRDKSLARVYLRLTITYARQASRASLVPKSIPSLVLPIPALLVTQSCQCRQARPY
jgi:hypothetical protein